MNRPIGDRGEGFIVSNNDEGLTKLVTKVEEELMELFFVLGIERSGGLVG